MSAIFSYKDAAQQIEAINLPILIKHYAKQQNESLSELSLRIGKNRSFISKHLGLQTIDTPLLGCLSRHLNTNLFEPICTQLPANITATPREKALQQQIAALQQELETIKRERDLLEKIAMR